MNKTNNNPPNLRDCTLNQGLVLIINNLLNLGTKNEKLGLLSIKGV
jgi:hypothetical protein